MKIVEQTTSRMVLRQRSSWLFLFIFPWASLFSGAPLMVIFALIASGGINQLSCDRVEATQVNCEFRESRFWGTIAADPIIIAEVTAAELQQETRQSDDGDYLVYRSVLLSPQKQINLSTFSRDIATNEAWVNQINQFLQSQPSQTPQPSQLFLSHDNRWNIPQRIAPILFLSLFVVTGAAILYATVRSQTLILDKSLNRLTYKIWTLLGTRQYDSPLGIIKQIDLKEHTDSYGNKSYEPILIPDPVKRISFAHASNRQEALQLQEKIQNFLNLSAVRPEAKLSTASKDGQSLDPSIIVPSIIYEAQQRTYQSRGLTEIPSESPQQVEEIDRQLSYLGLTWLGDLQRSTFPDISFYAYVHSSKDIYAIVMVIPLDKMVKSSTVEPIVSLDFWSHCFDGTLLITTSNKLMFRHLKAQKIKRWSHPDLDPIPLYQQHQQNLIELQAHSQRYRAQADLSAIAALLDDYLTRQSNGLLPIMATLINSITMLSQAKAKR